MKESRETSEIFEKLHEQSKLLDFNKISMELHKSHIQSLMPKMPQLKK